MNKLTKQQAWDLLAAYTETPALQRHALQVAAAMEHFARLAGEDPEVWWAAGLLHDLDYEKYPEEHCTKVREILREKGVDEAVIRAVARYQARKPPGKDPLHHRRADRPHQRGLSGPAVQKRSGPGGQIGQEKVQG